MAISIVIDVSGEAAGAPGVARTFDYAKMLTGPTVSLSLSTISGITSYSWEILDWPFGATEPVLSSSTSATPTFEPDTSVPGSYLIQCTVNGGEDFARAGIAFTTERRALRKPAAGETTQFDASVGWHEALSAIIDILDSAPLEESYGDPVQDLSALRAVLQAERADKQGRLVEDELATYTFDLGATVGGEIPADVDDGRWYKSGGAVLGAAGGDLGGTYPSPDVVKIYGAAVQDLSGITDEKILRYVLANNQFEAVDLEYRLPVADEISREYASTTSEVMISRFELGPGTAGKAALELYLVGILSDIGAVAAVVELRLYDMGDPGTPQSGDLRATISTTTTGSIIRESVALAASATPTSPGGDPNDGTIYRITRIYELRAIFTAGDAGDTILYDTIGILG